MLKTLCYRLQQSHCHFFILLGDGSSWIVGKFCTDPDGGEPMIFFKDFIGTKKDLETAKKECADGCDSNEDCKYAEILWIPEQVQYCSFWTKDECKLVDNGFKNSYNYKKQ